MFMEKNQVKGIWEISIITLTKKVISITASMEGILSLYIEM